VKRLILPVLALVALAACPKQQANRSLTGAPTPRGAVEQFMLAVRAQDLQAISTVWGNAKGPARDQGMTRAELEQRELLMVCFFNHDTYKITGYTEVNTKKAFIGVELKKGALTRTTEFTVEKGPSSRWYASVEDVTSVKDLCRPPQQQRPGNN
jgi:hypothetical protein